MKEIINPTNFSPLDKIRAVLVGQPGTEAVYGLAMPPEKSLFEANFNSLGSVVKASKDHVNMQVEFKKRGIEVYNMREIIGRELAMKENPFKNSDQLKAELRKRAYQLHQTYRLDDVENTIEELETLYDQDRAAYGEDVAIAINSVFTNCVDVDGNRKEFNVSLPPPANFLFWRDTNHITGSQVRTHRMFWDIRDQEVILAEIGLKALGINFERMQLPKGKSIEGGDVMPIEIGGKRYAFIGRAERTTDTAVDEWFKTHEKMWDQSGEGLIPAVVEGPRTNTQNQMHLDTYFQQVSKDSAIQCPELTDLRKISLLMRRGPDILRVEPVRFREWVDKQFGNVYQATRQEQLNYAPNILVDAGQTVYISRKDSPNFTEFLQKHVPEVVLFDMAYLTQMYGGAHCSTSEIREHVNK